MITSIDKDALPEDERDVAREIESMLSDLDREAKTFASALELYRHSYNESSKFSALSTELYSAESSGEVYLDYAAKQNMLDQYSKRQSVAGDWCKMAAQGGVIAAFTAHKIEIAIKGKLGKAPVLKSKLDPVRQKSVSKSFNESFPRISEIRNAIAHVGEIPLKEAELEKHRLRKEVDNEFIYSDGSGDAFVGASYMFNEEECRSFATMNGGAVSFELSEKSLQAMKDLADGWRVVFEGAESDWTLRCRQITTDLRAGKPLKTWF